MIDRLRILWILVWLGFGAWGVLIAVGAWRQASDYASQGTAARAYAVAGAADDDAWRAGNWHLGADSFQALADGDLVWRLSPTGGGGGGLALLSPAEGLARLDWPIPDAVPLTPDDRVVAVVRPDAGGLALVWETGDASGRALAVAIAGTAGWLRAPARLPLPIGAEVIDAAWVDGALRLRCAHPPTVAGGEGRAFVTVDIGTRGAPKVTPAAPAEAPADAPPAYSAPWTRQTSGVFRVTGAGRAVRDDRYRLERHPGGAREAQPVGQRHALVRLAEPPAAATAPQLLVGWSGVAQARLYLAARADARCPLGVDADRLIVHPRPGGYWLTDIASGCYLALDPELRRADDLGLTAVLERAGASPWALRWVLAGLPAAMGLGLLLLWLLGARPAIHIGLAVGAAGYVVSATLLWRQLAPLLGAA